MSKVHSVPAFDLGGRDLRVEVEPMPDEVRSAVLQSIAPVLRCVPAWLRQMTVAWDDDDTEHNARISADHVYRRATVYVCPPFLRLDARDRELVMVHEIVHMHLDVMHAGVLATVHAVTEEGSDLRSLAEQTVETAMESATEDLAHLIRSLLSGTRRTAWRFPA